MKTEALLYTAPQAHSPLCPDDMFIKFGQCAVFDTITIKPDPKKVITWRPGSARFMSSIRVFKIMLNIFDTVNIGAL